MKNRFIGVIVPPRTRTAKTFRVSQTDKPRASSRCVSSTHFWPRQVGRKSGLHRRQICSPPVLGYTCIFPPCRVGIQCTYSFAIFEGARPYPAAALTKAQPGFRRSSLSCLTDPLLAPLFFWHRAVSVPTGRNAGQFCRGCMTFLAWRHRSQVKVPYTQVIDYAYNVLIHFYSFIATNRVLSSHYNQ